MKAHLWGTGCIQNVRGTFKPIVDTNVIKMVTAVIFTNLKLTFRDFAKIWA